MDIRLNANNLIIEACQSRPQLVLELIGESPLVGVTMLWQASATGVGNLAVQLLLIEGCDPNFSRQSDGVSCLYVASQNGHADLCKILLTHGAMPNAQRNSKATPLFIATQRNHTSVVATLLEHGADSEIENDQHCTPFVLSCNMGHTDVAIMLLNHGCNFSHRKTGFGPLLWAKRERHFSTFNAISLWIYTHRIEPMVSRHLKSSLRASWSAWTTAALMRRIARDALVKQIIADAERERAAFLEGGPLSSMHQLADFDFSGQLHQPSIPPLQKLARDCAVPLPASIDPVDQVPQASKPQAHHDILRFLSPSTEGAKSSRLCREKLPELPTASMAYERQQKIRGILGGSVDGSRVTNFADTLCTQNFR